MFDPDDVVIFQVADDMGTLEEFRDVYGMRFVGLEDAGNAMYQAYRLPETEAPYPQDIIIDQFGRIAHWTWEYDPQELAGVIDYLLNCFCIVDPSATEPQLRLYAPRPSVFSRQTDLWFQLVDPGTLQIGVYDPAGRRVRTLVDGPRRAGDQRIVWNGRDDRLQPVPDGVYFVRMRAAGEQTSQRIVLIR